MTMIYELRERIKRVFELYDTILMPVFKFFAMMVVLFSLNRFLNFDTTLSGPFVTVVLALVGAVLPSSLTVLLVALISLIHLYKASVVLAIIGLLAYLLLYLLFTRYTPDLGMIIVGMPVLISLHVPYAVPILLGLFMPPTSLIAVGVGTMVYYILQVLRQAAEMSTSLELEELVSLTVNVVDQIMTNQMMLASVVVFCGTVLIVYFIRRQKFDYSFETALCAGTLFSTIGFLIAELRFGDGGSVLGIVFSNLLCGVFAYLVYFMKLALDYSRTERTQFEDDDYYYYVKAVPKSHVSEREKRVTKYGGNQSGGRKSPAARKSSAEKKPPAVRESSAGKKPPAARKPAARKKLPVDQRPRKLQERDQYERDTYEKDLYEKDPYEEDPYDEEIFQAFEEELDDLDVDDNYRDRRR